MIRKLPLMNHAKFKSNLIEKLKPCIPRKLIPKRDVEKWLRSLEPRDNKWNKNNHNSQQFQPRSLIKSQTKKLIICKINISC